MSQTKRIHVQYTFINYCDAEIEVPASYDFDDIQLFLSGYDDDSLYPASTWKDANGNVHQEHNCYEFRSDKYSIDEEITLDDFEVMED